MVSTPRKSAPDQFHHVSSVPQTTAHGPCRIDPGRFGFGFLPTAQSCGHLTCQGHDQALCPYQLLGGHLTEILPAQYFFRTVHGNCELLLVQFSVTLRPFLQLQHRLVGIRRRRFTPILPTRQARVRHGRPGRAAPEPVKKLSKQLTVIGT
jgi:hypothetical protein